MSQAIYAFGDSRAARERLDLLSRIFDPPSRALLTAAAIRRPALALDLGCGPGNTTALVSRVTGARRTIGLDRSAR